ncbi:hypothetical protein ACL9RL_11380 [Plantibacter sp. Mn2098]|uniref:hypothetical protein n=1 Tax=Plantibacter sp. Mn2098 TaxID=3395266 RepID=UPI003BED0232
MTENDPEYVKHQYLHMPWVESKGIVVAGKALGLYVVRQRKTGLTIACATKQSTSSHPEFVKLPNVTECSGGVVDGGVVIAWCPSREVMENVHHLKKSVVILFEWPSENHAAWAKLIGAYNVVTQQVMNPGLTDAGLKALEGVV